jgi:aminoglycoside phosphotransferase (APT) family kinase protein
VSCDPRNQHEIAAATLAWVQENVTNGDRAHWVAPLQSADAGLSTFIWFGQLAGEDLRPRYRQPLALRVFGTTTDDETLEREHAVMEFVATFGYPVPVPIAAVPSGPGNPVGLPWMVLPRVEGEPLLAVIGRAPWAAPRRLRELAELQVRLHAFPVDRCPLPASGALVDRWLEQRGADIASMATPRADAVLDAMTRKAGIVRDEQPVVCHGDFHPLNVLSRKDVAGWDHVVIDWTDAVVGDRHFDVARTIGLFRLAALAASSPIERAGLRIAGPTLARTYRRAYECGHPLDPDRLAFWTVAHFLYGWWQIGRLHAGAFESSRAETDAVPPALAEALLGWAESGIAALPEP